MEIEYLCDNIQYIDIVAKWIYTEFVDGIRVGIPYEKVEKSFKQRKIESIPISIVAINKDVCVGVASLLENDLKLRDYTPWLGGLYVSEEHRNQGIGKVLIEEIKTIAKRLGYDVLYLRTEHALEYYKKLDWQFVENLIDEFGIETSVFQKRL
ncbi:UNVERIFIED_CONTAM: putative acetyltransferase [Acetivibrio alkalicellulosi]